MFETVACVDTSYVVYHILFSAVKKWRSESPNSDVLDVDVNEDGFEQVDITAYPDFIDTLKNKIYETLRGIRGIVDDFNSTYGNHLKRPIMFVMDPPQDAKLKSWRTLVYKDYKGQRSAARAEHPFHVKKVFNEVTRLLLETERFRTQFDIDFVYADGCEADDIIAVYLSDASLKGCKKLLIANDKDYLQLENVTQITLERKEVEIEQPYPELITVTPGMYLLAKIITGDKSDNIPQVFPKVAYKKAVKNYVANLKYLTESLDSDAVAKDRFEKNAQLIDFKRIPDAVRRIARCVLGME